MKYTILSIAIFLLSNSIQAPAFGQTPRALEIGIFSIGTAVDAAAVRSVRQIIGRAVAKGVIDTYITTYDNSIEGGTTSCIQLSPAEDSKSLRQLESELLRIQPIATGYSVNAVAACKPASPQASQYLPDTEWVLADLGGAGVINNPQKPTLRFVGSDRIQGQGGCNSFSGNYQINGEDLTISALISTKRACVDSQAQEQENRYFQALERAQRVSIDGSALLIYSEGSEVPLRFSQLVPSS